MPLAWTLARPSGVSRAQGPPVDAGWVVAHGPAAVGGGAAGGYAGVVDLGGAAADGSRLAGRVRAGTGGRAEAGRVGVARSGSRLLPVYDTVDAAISHAST